MIQDKIFCAKQSISYVRALAYLCIAFLATAQLIAKEEKWGDLEKRLEPSLVEIVQIKIPHHPHAFNPSLVAWGDGWLLSFREIEQRGKALLSHLYFVKLNQYFQQVAPPQRINAGCKSPADARLLMGQEKLYCVYSHKEHTQEKTFMWRLWIAEVHEEEGLFNLHLPTPLTHFTGMHPQKDEKNWAPFFYDGQLLLTYSLKPHRIFLSHLGSPVCSDFSLSKTPVNWDWGSLRGGTPALLIDGRYLSFFHSAKWMHSKHSKGKRSYHYFMGVYTFSPTPPFALLEMSDYPIIGKGFYCGSAYTPYWKKSVQAIFPSGLAQQGSYLLVTYGRQDHEMWVAKFDKNLLLSSLKPLQPQAK